MSKIDACGTHENFRRHVTRTANLDRADVPSDMVKAAKRKKKQGEFIEQIRKCVKSGMGYNRIYLIVSSKMNKELGSDSRTITNIIIAEMKKELKNVNDEPKKNKLKEQIEIAQTKLDLQDKWNECIEAYVKKNMGYSEIYASVHEQMHKELNYGGNKISATIIEAMKKEFRGTADESRRQALQCRIEEAYEKAKEKEME